MANKKETVAKTTKKEEVKEALQDSKTINENLETSEVKEEAVELKKESDGKEWVKDWRDLVKVEGSKQDKFGVQYYGVKR